MMLRDSAIALLGFGLVLTAAGVARAATDAAAVGLSDPDTAAVSILESYFFTSRNYVPPVEIPRNVSSAALDASTPEGAALVHFSAMLDGDYARWLSSWDAPSIAFTKKRNAELGRNEKFWTDKWKEVLGRYSAFHLTRRVDTGPHVVIEMTASGSSREDFTLDVPLAKQADGRWRASQEIASDPVFINWRRPGQTTEVMKREPPDL